jgi:hypothetical protein
MLKDPSIIVWATTPGLKTQRLLRAIDSSPVAVCQRPGDAHQDPRNSGEWKHQPEH